MANAPTRDHPLDREQLRERVQQVADATIAEGREVLERIAPEVGRLVDELAALLQGGKRLRPAFLYWGYRAGGAPGDDAVIRLATAMEFFQAAALIHDDVMDKSMIRRNRPTVHVSLARAHKDAGWGGGSQDFGMSGAILAGDLCLGWSDRLVSECGLPPGPLAAARVEYDLMRTQLMGGQYLDVWQAARGWEGDDTATRIAAARRVIRYKSAKYSIEQPLLIGLKAAGMPERTYPGASAYGLALGEAFQLRDDLLGVYGDPDTTGKPAGDDLREGKRTVLIAEALACGDPSVCQLLADTLGSADLTEDQVDQVRAALHDCGAVAAVEARIEALVRTARTELAAIPDLGSDAREMLDILIGLSTDRST